MSYTPNEDVAQQMDRINVLYPPSWFDRFSGRVEALRIPYWIFYLIMGLLLVGIGLVTQSLEGRGPLLGWDPIGFVAIFQIAYIYFILHYLDKQALKALEEFRPALKPGGNHMSALRWSISTLPTRNTLVASVVAMLFGLFLIIGTFISNEAPGTAVSFEFTPFGVYMMLVFLLLWLTNGLFVYHTIHQLKVVNTIYTHYAVVHPFHQRELYAFSGFSARTGIGIVLITPLWMIFDPGIASFSIAITFAIFGVIAFLSPLVGVHRILDQEKDRLLDENTKQVETTINSLMLRLQKEDYEGVEKSNQALTSLEKARQQIERIKTWPWRTETPRQLILAILLPLFLWFVQYFLGRLFSG